MNEDESWLRQDLDLNQYTILHDRTNVEWVTVIYKFLAIHTYDSWRWFLILTILASFYIDSYFYIFLRHRMNITASIIIVSLDIIYLVDFLLALFSKFIRDVQLYMMQPPRGISLLIFQFIMTLPLSLVYELGMDGRLSITILLRSITFLRLLHVFLFFHEKSKCAGLNLWKYFLTQYLINVFLLHHALACIWYIMGKPIESDQLSGWARSLQGSSDEFTTRYWYLICLYFAMITTTTCGFGNLVPFTLAERILSIIGMMIGFTLATGVFIGTLSSVFQIRLNRKAHLQNQLHDIKHYLNVINVPKKDRNTIMTYYDILWKEKKGVHHANYLRLLPFPLRTEICFDLNIRALQCSHLFRDKPESFLRAISHEMLHEFYQPGDMIYHQNVIKNKMIFIVHGVVDILSEEDNQSPIISFGPGTCLGEVALILTLPAKSSVQAKCYTEIQVLYRKAFIPFTELYPDLVANIRNAVFDRTMNSKLIDFAMINQQTTPVGFNYFISQYTQTTIIKTLKEKLRMDHRQRVFSEQDRFLSMYRLKDNVKCLRENLLCLQTSFPWILEPNTSLTEGWEIVIVITSILIGVLYPYYIAYIRLFPPWLDTLSLILELILVIDIYVILTTAVVEKNQIIISPMKILRKRLTEFGFYLDMLSSVYLEVFALIMENKQRYYYLFKLNRLFKTYRVFKFFNRLENTISCSTFPISLIKYAVYLLICPFWVGTLLYLAACFNEICLVDGWFNLKLMEDRVVKIVEPCTSHESLMSSYFALSCMAALGFGDIPIGNESDIIIVYFAVVFGFLLFGYCTAELSAIITHKLENKTEFQSQLHAIKVFMNEKKLKRSIKRRIIQYCEVQWYYDEGKALSKVSLLYNASKRIQIDMQLKEKMQTIMSVPLFQNVNLDFIQLIVSEARTMILPPNEIIVYEGGVVKDIYIIQEGYCMILGVADGKSQIRTSPTHFGGISLLMDIPSLVTISTITHVKMIAISKDFFWQSLSMFPSVSQIFRQVANEYKDSILFQKTRDKALKILEESKNEDYNNALKSDQTFHGSFINVYRYCKKRGENYHEPFRKLGFFVWFKFLLLPFCIIPDGIFIKVWVSLRLLVALIIAFLMPYQQVLSPYGFSIDRILLMTDLFTYLDLYVLLYVGYYGSENQLIIHPLKTASHYLKHSFIVDFLLCFPYELIIRVVFPTHDEGHSKFIHQTNPHVIHCVVRLIRVLQVYRLPQMFGYLKKNIHTKGHITEILKFVLITLTLINVWATVVIILSCRYWSKVDLENAGAIKDGIVVLPGMAKHPVEELLMICKRDSWIDRSKYRNYTSVTSVYTLSFYFCTSSLLGCGFGDITPQYVVQVVTTMITIICGILFFGYIFAMISSHKTSLDSLLSKQQEMIKELRDYMIKENVDIVLQKNIISHYEYAWRRTRGTDPSVMLSNLHVALHEDAVLTMYERTLKEVPLFEDVDRSFFRIIGQELKERYFLRRSIIYKADDVAKNIYIIYRGKVEINSKFNDMQAFMSIGGIFGNLAHRKKKKISVTITALTNIDALYMNTSTFYHIIKNYPTIRNKITEMVEENTDFIVPATFIEDEADDTDDDIDDKEHMSGSSKSSISLKPSSLSATSKTTVATNVSARMRNMVFGFCLLCMPHKWCRVAILPETNFFLFTDGINMVAAYINCILATYAFSFQNHSVYIIITAIVIDTIFFLKLFLELHKAHENRYGEYVLSNKKILKRYFSKKKRVLLECIANLPIYYFVFLLPIFTDLDPFLFFVSLRLITLLRVIYIFDYYRARSNKLMVNKLYLRISAIFLWSTLIIHFLACIWYLFACPLTYCRESSWFTAVDIKTEMDHFEKYIFCVYFIVNVFTTTGQGDILPNNVGEIVYVIIVMIVTKFLIGLFIADVMNVYSSYRSSLVAYECGIKELKDYLQNGNLSNYQMEKMWQYVRQLWTRNYGKQIPTSIHTMPDTDKRDLMLEVYGHHLRNSYIFADLEESFLRQMAGYFKPTIFFPGNYIVQHGDSDKSMYFIHRGEISILTVHPNLTETIHEVLREGDMFGLAQGLFHGVPHYFSFRARTVVDIVSLCLSDWEELLEFFPNSKSIIYQRANEVYGKI